MRPYVSIDQLEIDKALYEFVNREAMPGTGVAERPFWSGFARLVRDLAPRNAALLRRRDELQSQDRLLARATSGCALRPRALQGAIFSKSAICMPEGAPFSIDTANVDPEIAQIAGPQLVVPVSNARYALNAANARWGSLYDALYGTDAIAAGRRARRRRLRSATRRAGHRLRPRFPR